MRNETPVFTGTDLTEQNCKNLADLRYKIATQVKDSQWDFQTYWICKTESG